MIDIGYRFRTCRSGWCEVIAYEYPYYTVRFDSGHKAKARGQAVKKGNIKDPYFPIIAGVGYFGEGPHKSREKGKKTKVYNVWNKIIRRCYEPKVQAKCPTYEGCSVDERWHNFQNFAEWYEINYFDGAEVDKDIKVKGNRIYGPDTCLMVPAAINTAHSSAKTYYFYSPQGKLTKIHNMKKFCRENDLHACAMYSVIRGEYSQHKGWKWCEHKKA